MYNKKNYMGDPLICLLTVCVLLGEPCPDHTCISQGLPEVDTCKDPNIQEWLKDTVGSNVGRARYTLVRYTRPLFIRTMAIAVGRSIIANPADTKKLIEDIYEKNPSYFCPVTDIQTIMGGGADDSLDDHKDRWTRDHDNFDALCEADDKHVLAMSTHDDDTDREETDIFIYRAHIWLQKSAAATKCKGTEWFSMFKVIYSKVTIPMMSYYRDSWKQVAYVSATRGYSPYPSRVIDFMPRMIKRIWIWGLLIHYHMRSSMHYIIK